MKSVPQTLVEAPVEGELIDISTWQQKLARLATEQKQDQISLPRTLAGRRVNREEIANAFLVSFELIGGVPRLALWADEHPSEFFKIFGRLLPKEVLTTHDGVVTIKHAIQPSKLDDEHGN